MRIVTLILALVFASAAQAQDEPRSSPSRVIDVHLHGYENHRELPPAPYRGADAEGHQIATPANGADHRVATLAAMERNNIVLGIVSATYPDDDLAVAREWAGQDGPKILSGASHIFLIDGTTPEALATLFDDGTFFAFGELGLQYVGATLDEDRFEPFLAMAEEKGIPVGIHTGLGPPERARTVAPNFRVSAGNPLHLEEVLIRHPKLKIWAMHSGFPWDAEMFAIMQQYTNLYVDVSPHIWMVSQEVFDERMKWLIDYGMGERIMFGTDQMLWPQAIEAAVDKIENSTVLTREQKDDIFFNNAMRFFGFDEETLDM